MKWRVTIGPNLSYKWGILVAPNPLLLQFVKYAQKGLKLWDEFWSSPYGKYAGAGMPGGKLQGINKFRPNYEHFRDGDEVDDLGWRRRK